MLDQSTKRKIDSARNILVGKVPDPKAQVEQITTALIYKFMDDMDKESEELGGKSEFFSNGYEKYSWTKLMDKRLSGQERLDLYVQAISNMSKNPHIPQLFRNIFKDAFLPYRDFETLSLFLKEIDEFTYEHSENLGDAFEYLLAVLGSQGNAGQFRTPRHIIDFIVEVVDPKKKENILDPACGTAGFLISAYKHIIKHNSSNFIPEKEKAEEIIQEGESAAETVLEEKSSYTGDKLSPDEKANVMKNIAGYDISPDMVKLSLVNLYLHGFSNPVIHEYDTLTSEKRWNESFDVIMANPPFMTPKGGIRPHKRFQVQANRSEVLFVDYILEHLNLNGRAGIIVPEGIIFQSSTAYKRLRKLLIEDGLFAVVSLPPGVFNPYSGVKTSILFFDNQLAKKTEEILFVKAQNDGFDLGAQRRKIAKNDLPEALSIIEAWKNGEKQESKLAIWADKEKIAESGAYNLTGDRYREVVVSGNQKWPLVELGDEKYFKIESGGTPASKNEKFWNGEIDWATLVDLPAENRITEINETQRKITQEGLKNSSAKLLPVDSVLVSSRATIGRIAIGKTPLATNQGFKNIIIRDPNQVDPQYLANVLTLKVEEMQNLGTGGTYKEISKSTFSTIKIPLPPLKVQKEIVEQIEVKQNAIEHAREVIKNLERERRYFGQSLRKLDVEMIELGNICENFDSIRKPVTKSDRNKGKYPYYGASGIVDYVDNYIFDENYLLVSEDGANLLARTTPIAFSVSGKIWVNNHAHILKFGNLETQKFVELYINSIDIKDFVTGAAQPKLNQANLNRIKIPLPKIELQKKLVADAETEEEIIKSNQVLIDLMKAKINNVLSEI